MAQRNRWVGIGMLLLLGGVSACGYGLKNSNNPLAEREGIRKIYIRPIDNSSFTVGVEHIVYNALVKNITGDGRLVIVREEKDADAVLAGTVGGADASAGATVPGQSVGPAELASFAPPLTAEYIGSLSCSFTLTRTSSVIPKGKQATVWSSGFSRVAPFPGSLRLGVAGTTTSLINDSEFTRALKQMADIMGRDVSESMTSVF